VHRFVAQDFNCAALQIASLLNMDVDKDRERTPADWAKLRAAVREALKREAIKTKKQPSPEATPKRGQ